MYGYEPFIELTTEQILQKVTQEQLFEFALKEPFSYSFRYISPFREDTKAGCRFEVREDGTILFVDFGERYLTGRTHRNCWRMVMDKFRCDLTTSIKIICQHFDLPLDKSQYKEIVVTEYEKRETTYRADINYIAKPLVKTDVIYWSQFLIRPEHLQEDNVFSVKRYTINSPNKGASLFTPYKHCYVFDFIDRFKIYQPYQTDFKWVSNCDENNIGNIDNLPATGDELIIQKSYKDHRVIRNVLPNSNVIWFQNEGCVPDIFILKNLVERFKLITIFYDNDEDGIIAALKLQAIFNEIKPSCCRVVYIPDDIPYKDPGEFVSKEGRFDLIEILKYIELWGETQPMDKS